MEEQAPANNIEILLEELNSQDSRHRWQAVRKVRDQKISDERIVERIRTLASTDSNATVRNYARWALGAMSVALPPPDPALAQEQRDFRLGVILFIVINIAMSLFLVVPGRWYWLNTTGELYTNTFTTLLTFPPFLINIGILILLAFLRRHMALGMLAGIGMALLIGIGLVLGGLAICGVGC